MIKKADTASIANDAPGERRFDIIRKIIYKPGPMSILSSTGVKSPPNDSASTKTFSNITFIIISIFISISYLTVLVFS